MKKLLLAVVILVSATMFFGCAHQQKKKVKAPDLQRIHFDLDKSNIKPEYEPVLRGNAAWMQANPKALLTVEGHCDERGSVEYNIALGDRRANSAKNYMTNLGIPDSRMRTVSYGKERPLCTEHTEACWWQNRRDEFVGASY